MPLPLVEGHPPWNNVLVQWKHQLWFWRKQFSNWGCYSTPNTHCLEPSCTRNCLPTFMTLVHDLYTQTSFFSQNQLVALLTWDRQSIKRGRRQENISPLEEFECPAMTWITSSIRTPTHHHFHPSWTILRTYPRSWYRNHQCKRRRNLWTHWGQLHGSVTVWGSDLIFSIIHLSHWYLTLHWHSPFQLCSFQTFIDTSYGNPVLLAMLYLLPFPFILNALLPRKHSLLTSYPLSHHPSVTFYNIPWSMPIVGHYKYRVTLYS